MGDYGPGKEASRPHKRLQRGGMMPLNSVEQHLAVRVAVPFCLQKAIKDPVASKLIAY